jgi:RNA polymerase sigma-70 factor, ECF subfamily
MYNAIEWTIERWTAFLLLGAKVALSPFNDEFLARVTQSQGRIFGYLYSVLRNLDDAEDVMQDAILAMWRRFDDFDRSRPFVAWAMKFAEFSALNHLRSKRRNPVFVNEELVAALSEVSAKTATADVFDVYQDALLRCLDRLTPADRDLIRLCYFEKCSVKNVAEQLGRSSQSVCNSLRRIRGQLYDCIEQSNPPEDRR